MMSRKSFPGLITESGQISNGGKIFGFIILVFFVLAVVDFLPIPGSLYKWVSIASVLGVSWFCLKLEDKSLTSIGLRLNARFMLEFLFGILLGALLILLIALIIKYFGGFTWARNPQVSIGSLFYALVPFLGISLYEELLFRGYAFQRAIRGMGNAFALLLFALFFVIVHWNNPGMEGGTKVWGSLNIGLASLLLGLSWIKTKSLAVPVGFHLGWNWAQGSLLGFGVSGTKSQGFWIPAFCDVPQWLTGGDFGLEAALPTAIILTCSMICISLIKYRPSL